MLNGTAYSDFRTDLSPMGEILEESLSEDSEEVGSSSGFCGHRLCNAVIGCSHQIILSGSTKNLFFESGSSALQPSTWMMPLRI